MEFGTSTSFKVVLNYDGGYSLTSAQDSALMPPQAVSANWTVVKYDGTKSVAIWLSHQYDSLSNLKEITSLYPDLTFTIELISQGETVWVVSGQSVQGVVTWDGDWSYKVWTLTLPQGTVTKKEECTVRITSVANGLTGGSLELPSIVGKTTRAGAGSHLVSLTLLLACIAMLLTN